MIPLWLGKIAAKQIIKAVKHKIDLKKIDKYVNKPNELDVQLKFLQRTVNKQGRYIEELEKDVAEVKKVAHTPIDGLTNRLKDLEKKVRF